MPATCWWLLPRALTKTALFQAFWTPHLVCASGTHDRCPAALGAKSFSRQYWRTIKRWPFLLATVFFGFDLQGWITVIGGFLLGLITLFTGYDHVDFFGRATVGINQQVGLLVIVASLATLVVEAQLASRRRYRDQIDCTRAANATARERDFAARERDLADQERNRADQERQRAARRAQRQDRCTLAQREFQFSPTAVNRQRLSDLIALLREYGELA